MSAICLCGVCIPYSAIIPLLLVVLQYITRPLYQMGLIPDGLAKKLGITINTALRVTANDSNKTKKWAKSHIQHRRHVLKKMLCY